VIAVGYNAKICYVSALFAGKGREDWHLHVHETNLMHNALGVNLVTTIVLCTGQYKVQHLLAALSEMAHIDDSLAHSLWVLLLPIIWATLGEIKDQQVRLR
jgi:hypothetical protein